METFSPSFESQHLQTPEQEIAFLRERLAQKEREVSENAASKAESRSRQVRTAVPLDSLSPTDPAKSPVIAAWRFRMENRRT